MNTETYNQRCQELGQLADEATKLEGLTETTRRDLSDIRDDIRANHYRIVLLGSFQSGKSTIFNTACGGRQLSPTGYGIKTSACAVEAHYLPEGDEFARLHWRSDEELLRGFIRPLLPHLADAVPNRFKDKSEQAAAAEIVLAKEEARRLLEKAVGAALQARVKDPSLHARSVDSSLGDEAELLKLAELVLQHYGNAQLRQNELALNGNRLPVDAAYELIRFPEHWGERAASEFTAHQAMFLFMKRVEFHLRSPDLEQLRAVLVDSPGLNASRWDTDVAHDSVRTADAIVWLQGSEGRTLSASEIEEARRLANFGIASTQIFVGFNAKGVTMAQSQPILAANLCLMREQAGLNVPQVRVTIFNALLALRVRQQQSLLDGGPPPATEKSLSDMALKQIDRAKLPEGGTSQAKNAAYLIRRDLRRLANDFLCEDGVDEQDRAVLERLACESQWGRLIGEAAQFIVFTRGRSRLIERGVKRVEVTLKNFDSALSDIENNLGLTETKHVDEKKLAEQALKEFEERVNGLLRNFERKLGGAQEHGEPTDFVQELIDELDSRIRSARSRDKLKVRLEELIDKIGKQGSERDIPLGIRGEVTEHLRSRIDGWQHDMREGKTAAAARLAQQLLGAMDEEMQKRFCAAVGRGGHLLADLQFDFEPVKQWSLDAYQGPALNRAKWDVDGWLDTIESKWNWPHWIRGGWEMVRKSITGRVCDTDAWKKRLDDYLNEVFGGSLEGFLNKAIRGYVEIYRQGVQDRFKTASDKVRKQYDSRVKERELLLAQTRAQREAASREAGRTRKEVLEPFQTRLEEFQKTVEPELVEPA